MKPSRTRFPLDVDYREGSGKFTRPLVRMGLPARTRTLEYADFAWTGNGPWGHARVGVERKTVSEIVGALGGDKRFARRQLPGLLTSYDYVWLIVEGPANPDAHSGLLMWGNREAGYTRQRYMYSAYKRYLQTIAVKGRVFVEPSYSFTETLWLLESLYGWWQASWNSHRSTYEVDETEPDSAITAERTLVRKMANQLPGVSWTRSLGVSRTFGSPEEMCGATVAQWMKALGVEKGRALATAINRACRTQGKWG